MAKKIKLDSTCEFKDLTIIGINCSLPDYRLIWCLNNTFEYNLIKYDDFGFEQLKQDETINFSFYQYHDIENFKWYYFLSNKTQNKFLINEYKSFNFLLIIKGIVNETLTIDTLNKIKNIKNVQLAVKIDLTRIKNLDLILNDFEMFTYKINKTKK